MKYTLLLSIVLLYSCSENSSQGSKASTSSEDLPNIVYIFTDDLGYGDLGCFGATDIKTPSIDRMAQDGMKFTEFYSASPVCSPSRAALMTGRLPQRMGINAVFFPESFTGMPNDETTIAELLKQKNYTTGIVGKWHLGHRREFLPLQQGFDEYFGIPYSNDMESVVYMRGNEVESFHVDQHYTTKRYTEEAIDFINRHHESPFYLYLSHNMPHVPIYASEDFLGTSERGLYGDVIQEIDWSVGEVMKALEAHDLMENTLIVFSSDNGPWLVMEDHGGSAGILREGKQYTFEGGMRVPTLAMWQGEIPGGSVYNDMASQMDWFPTFASIAGVDVPDDKPIDGVDISNVLFNGGERGGDQYLFFNGEDLRCYREGQWKVKKPFGGFEGTRWKKAVSAHDTLLFNLKDDPGEQNNLYAENKPKAKEMLIKMHDELERLGPLPASLVERTPADESHYDHVENNDD